MKSKSFSGFSFQSKWFFRFTWICLIVMNLCLPIWASNNVQEDSRRLIRQADNLARKGNLAEAENILRRVIKENPNHTKAKLSLSYVLLRGRNLREAYDISLEVAKAEPKNARAFALIGTTLLSFGSFRDAKVLLENAYVLNSKEPLMWFGLGMLDFYENRINASIPKLQQAEFFESNNPDFVFSFAQVLARAERYKEAGDAYERFLKVSATNDYDRRERIKGLISFLRYLGHKQELYAVNNDVKQVVVPINLIDLRPVIEVSVGDKKEKFRFVLDTGSGMSVISDRMAQKLKMKPVARGGMARAIGGSGKFEIVYGFLNSINIGDAKIRNVPVYIRKFHEENDKYDGYIGLSLISKFLTTVDYGNLSFTLTRKNQAVTQKFESDALALPLRLTPSGFLSGEVSIEGVDTPLNFIVDTGANISVISDELAQTNGLRRFQIEEKMRVVGAAGVTENVNLFLLPRVTFGNHTRERIRAVALNLNVINEASGFIQAGILGGNFLRNYRLTFDFQNSKVTFVPVTKK